MASIRSFVTLFVVPLLISVLVFISSVAFWIDRSAGSETAFRAHAAEVLSMDSSQAALAERFMDEAVDAVPLLALVRGAGERATVVLLDSGAFDGAMERLITDGHRHVVSRSSEPFVADLTDVRSLLIAPIEQIAPELAARVPADAFEEVVILDSEAVPVIGAVAGWLPFVSVSAAALATFLGVTAVALARRRGMVLTAVGLAILFAGVGVYVWAAVGGPIAETRISDELTRVLVVNGYAVFSRSLGVEGLALMIGGFALTAAGLGIALVGRRGTQLPGVERPVNGLP